MEEVSIQSIKLNERNLHFSLCKSNRCIDSATNGKKIDKNHTFSPENHFLGCEIHSVAHRDMTHVL